MEKNDEKTPDVPMVEQYKVDAAIVHASKLGKIALIICICASIAIASSFFGIVRVVDIFTTRYNERTTGWIAAFMELADRLGVPEVADDTIQQFAPP